MSFPVFGARALSEYTSAAFLILILSNHLRSSSSNHGGAASTSYQATIPGGYQSYRGGSGAGASSSSASYHRPSEPHAQKRAEQSKQAEYEQRKPQRV